MSTNTNGGSRRGIGPEIRAARWAIRHPGMIAMPTMLGTGELELLSHFGPIGAGSVTGALALGVATWYRAHPDSFDSIAAPRIRAAWRRWAGPYMGVKWRDLCDATDLAKEHRRKGITLYPRVLKVQAFSPHVDLVHIHPAKGQSIQAFESRLADLTAGLRAERIALEPLARGRFVMIVQRTEPFTEVIPAPEMPQYSKEVDPARLYVGEDEFGNDWTESLVGTSSFLLVAGAVGAGKNSIPLALLRGLAPMIRDGLCKVWIIDPKQLEFAALKPITFNGHAYATVEQGGDGAACLDLLDDYIADMERTQRRIMEMGVRSVPISEEFPLNVLIVDEVASLVAYTEDSSARGINAKLARIASMGRTTHHSMVVTTVDPGKDVIEFRDLFPSRICLRVSAPTQPNMVLGEDARERGAVADEIPLGKEFIGIGYAQGEKTKNPRRVRAAYTSDRDMHELVEFVTRRGHLRSVA
ncbi:FtsK/SpoIIIE domain-containing protein [Kutzneria kofuensis]|uniref:S-DNA-T family DNA segregation ATPase FtsK/SpoIIIE n=1 Tax=Kutzneria kofuensis TaxID=103725 RepID=A0A7W9KDL7_9PSEU|nr:FtsK/SpoIIIE domain-containing protein [Kutzneria kofuensis]MBB5890669.1 S-DNA-T family DNA segregation ATPase FtsK/SpoIIIE [Kutzneria kofuensis]